MSRPGRAMSVAALASLPVLPLGWFVGLQAHPPWVAAAYLAYFLVVLAVPGTMFWRRLTGGSGWFAVDAVLGTTFGLACEVLIYPLGRWLDIPLAALVMPALALGLFLAVPSTARSTKPTPWWSVAGVMVVAGVVAAWFVRVGSRVIPLDGPAALRPNSDSPFQLSLAAELTHHFPPQVPYVAGEPLTYHWMAYNHIASAHWITGIELDVLTQRVVPFAFLLLTTLAAAAVGMVLTGRAVAAPIAAGLTVLAGDLGPWGWTVTNTLYHDSPLSMGSPTQAFSTILMLPLVAVTAQLLRRPPGQTRQQLAGLFLAAGILISVLSISTATALPVYGAGLAAAWIYLTIKARRLNLRALVLGLTVAATYAFAFFIVLRGASQGMQYKAGGTYRTMLARMLHGIDPSVQAGRSVLLIVAAAVAIGWLMPAVGALLIKRRLPRDPMVVFLLAGLMGAVAATSLLYQHSQAQVFFARTAFIYGVLLAAWGLASLERRQYLVVGPALVVGVAAIYVGRAQTKTLIRDCQDTGCLERIVSRPLIAALILTAAGIVIFGLSLRRRARTGRTWAIIAVSTLIGLTVSPTAFGLRQFAFPAQTAYDSIAPGGIEAARFIRRQSAPDDLIATNIHCHAPTGPRCNTGSFWIPGYAERRVLVEGWSYTAKANDVQTLTEASYGPFWDKEKLKVNDEAFTAPTREILDRLRTQYGVRWLLADDRVNPAPEELEKLAELRFQSGTVRVYQLYPPRVGAGSTPIS